MNARMNNFRGGFSIVEIVLAAALFALFSVGAVGLVVQGLEANRLASEQAIANQFASEGLEMARAVRNQNFSGLSGYSGINNNFEKYTRTISSTAVDADTYKITSTVNWAVTAGRNNSVVLSTYLTNWRQTGSSVASQSAYLNVATSSAVLDNSNKDVTGITLSASGTANITIVSMTVSWSNVNTNRRLNTIRINGANVWTGSAASGLTEDIADVVLTGGAAAIPLDYLRYNNSVNNIILILMFTMEDGSTKSATINL